MDVIEVNKVLNEELACRLKSLEDVLVINSFDFIVTHCEINNRQGVGIILQRIFGRGENVLSLRSHNLYDSNQNFAEYDLYVNFENSNISPSDITDYLKNKLGKKIPKRILSVPYYQEDVIISLALKDLFDVPLCTYLMDDQNIYEPSISDNSLKELFDKSDLCLGISQQLCEAYSNKYKHKFWWLPPVVEKHLISPKYQLPKPELLETKTGIVIGNIWSQEWLNQLAKITQKTGINLNWYGNPNREWLQFEEQELANNGISFQGYCNEWQLIQHLRESPYAVIPTAITDNLEAENRLELAYLSLPSRLIFMLATANIPIIVVGTSESAVAQFVQQFDLGFVCEYDEISFGKAVNTICNPQIQAKIRQQASKLAVSFSADDIANWIWDSLAQKKARDLRFEKLSNTLFHADVILVLDEMNYKHGTGALIQRIFPDNSKIISIRSFNHYNGEQNFGKIRFQLNHGENSRPQVFVNTIKALGESSVKRVFCVPYNANEVRTAIAIKELYNVPLGSYVMDDQNICVNRIPDDLMREFLQKCAIRFATHPELRDAYEEKYQLKSWVFPAIVPHKLIKTEITTPDESLTKSKTGALIGSLWSRQWYEMLRDTIINTGFKLDWYGNCHYNWMSESQEDLKKQGINPYGLVTEEKLAQIMPKYPYIVVPTGTLDYKDDRPELSQLSLPGRIIFALATSNTPIILLGSKKTSPAKFIQRFQNGVICDYDAISFQKAVEYITNPDVQLIMRQNAAEVANGFSDLGITEWVWKSLELGKPYDSKFEDLMCRPLKEITF